MPGQKSFVRGYGFGTAPVFLAAISTILGAILFLRFGYAVANAGLFGTIAIICIGHAITVPTAMAIAEIATDLKVGGGGEYFIISRSFGSLLGGTIGISLYFSQAISVAFYMIAFSQAFTPLFGWFQNVTGVVPDARMISLPATFILLLVILKKGANIGVTALWVVVTVLGVSLVMFFLGGPTSESASETFLDTVTHSDSFFKVFAIIFPAFTGMTAGVGLSGDLKNPRRSIPLGTLSATIAGMIVYIFVVLKLAYSATPQDLAGDQLIMSKIALWGPIIPVGLAAATLSSAIGSILIAPRTMQALAGDRIFPTGTVNLFLSQGKGDTNEPVRATLVTSVIVLVFVTMGSVDFVAQIISMFFMITYGALCLVSFLEHLAGNPSYRPTFRSRWYVSLVGAIACFVMMFQMQPLYALFAIIVMVVIYVTLKRSKKEETDLADVFKGVLFQMTRKLQVMIQKRQAHVVGVRWRPSFIAISSSSLTRLAPYDLLRWISHHYGFGCFFHFIKGSLNEENATESKKTLARLIEQGVRSEAGIYADTIISPSFRTAVAQIIQAPGVFGIENNSILFEFRKGEEGAIEDIIDGAQFASALGYSICVLRSSERHFGYRKKIHIWLTPGDYRNVNLMILLAYILMGHPEWKGCDIEIFAAFKNEEMDKEVAKLNQLIERGRIPISQQNVQKVPFKKGLDPFEELVTEHSAEADLVITGFSLGKLVKEEGRFFKSFEKIEDILFVRAGQRIIITDT
ncbi:MAG: amino acid permease [Gemmatimonadota bacterium]|nr:MAG: amino acid permease [Gemmatimonadota bacterium]